MPTGDSELVQVLVPRALLVDVYEFIASKAGSTNSAPPRDDGQHGDSLPDEWSVALIRRMYIESGKNMRALLDTLVDRVGEEVTASDLKEVLAESRGDGADSSVLGGTLGAFKRRVSHRYEREEWPFENRWDHDRSEVVYRMGAAVADIIKQVQAS